MVCTALERAAAHGGFLASFSGNLPNFPRTAVCGGFRFPLFISGALRDKRGVTTGRVCLRWRLDRQAPRGLSGTVYRLCILPLRAENALRRQPDDTEY